MRVASCERSGLLAYSELIKDMIHVFKNVKKRNQFDEFLHKIQQAKMKELWDNKADEEWENA
jgi:hypothetical protein